MRIPPVSVFGFNLSDSHHRSAHRMPSLEDIENAMLAGESKLFQSIPVFVVNWVSRPPHPNKFTYIVCSKDVGGRRCMTSVGGRSPCTHRGAAVTIAYRFDVMLTDGLRQGKPVKATLFEAASALLGDTYPSTFRALPAEEQQSLVDRVCKGVCQCIVSLRVGNRGIVVQTLDVIRGPDSPTASRSAPPDRDESQSRREIARRKFEDLLDQFSSTSLGS
ncbi:hypothetical protein R1sor_014200 [Riccia sorocarpa]|uniref:Uncharacterized protein n=1 Tax=Riccia sorocarpa TaxID=122646 RepID=A0ABD3HAK2_9MARC